MSNDALPEYNPTSGYPESSPAEGAEPEGATPTPESQHEPQPGSPRWNEVYRNWKDTQRDLEQTREELAELNLQRQMAPPSPDPTPQPNVAEDDGMDWFWEKQKQLMADQMKPLQDRIQQQEQQERTRSIISNFESAHPEYDRSRDQEVLVGVMRQYGVQNPEAAYRIAFPERVVGSQKPEPPVADLPGATAHVPAESPEALMQRFNDPRTTPEERAMIATKLTDMGGFGADRAEKALGF